MNRYQPFKNLLFYFVTGLKISVILRVQKQYFEIENLCDKTFNWVSLYRHFFIHTRLSFSTFFLIILPHCVKDVQRNSFIVKF